MTDPTPLVTVVTPSLNQGAFIRQTIESVLDQDYPRLTYWVMDGGSADGTVTILREYAGRPNFHWQSGPDGGQAAAIQAGWGRGQGDIIAWLNADDLYRPGAVRQAVAALQAQPEAALVYGRAALIDDAGRRLGQINQPDLTLTDLLGLVHFLPQPATFLRAGAVHRVGGLNTSLTYAFDLDLFLRLAARYQIGCVAAELAAYRWHGGAKTAAAYYDLRREAAQVSQAFLRRPALPLTRRAQKRFLSYAYLVEGYAQLRLGRRRAFLGRTLTGLAYAPGNSRWLLRRVGKHIRQMGDDTLAYPYDPALS